MNPKRVVQWLGPVNQDVAGKVVEKILQLFGESSTDPIYLLVCTNGGDLTVAFGFFDLIMGAKIPLTTIGIGGVRSAGLIIFLSGEKRLVGPNVTALIHPSTRSLNDADLPDQKAFVLEGEIMDKLYSEIVKNRSGLDPKSFLTMKRDVTILDAKGMLECGFAQDLWVPETVSSPVS